MKVNEVSEEGKFGRDRFQSREYVIEYFVGQLNELRTNLRQLQPGAIDNEAVADDVDRILEPFNRRAN